MKNSSLYKKRLIVGINVLFTAFLAIGQPVKGVPTLEPTIVSGRIIDAETGKAIENVNIYIENSNTGDVTDKNVFFKIELSLEKTEILIVGHISYEKHTIKLQPDRDNTNLVIRLIPRVLPSFSQIIVTATRDEKRKLDIPQASEIVRREEVTENVYTALVDLLDRTPGFTQIWEYHSPLVLRGVSSKHLVVLKDGNRRVGNFPGGDRGQAMNIYDIDRIEIILGPGSVMYGTGAIAGMVNVITPDPFEIQGLQMRVEGGFGSNNLERISLAGLNWGNKKIAMKVTGRLRKADEYVYGDGTTAENSFIEDKDIAAHIGWKPADKHTLILNTDFHFGGPWGKPVGFNNNVNMKANNEEEAVHTSLRYIFKNLGVFEKIVLSGFYDHVQRDYHKRVLSAIKRQVTMHRIVHYKNNYGGGQMYASVIPAEGHLLSFGIDGYLFRMWSPSDNTDYLNNITTQSKGVENAGISSIGLFLQEDLTLVSHVFSLIAGLRYDIARVQEGDNPVGSRKSMTEQRDAFSGNIGLNYHPTERTSLTLNLGRAFRMPGADEMFSETITCRGVMLGNPDLEPEYSWNFDLGYRGSLDDLEFDAALFANFLDDFISRYATPEISDVDYIYGNVDKSRIMGSEFIVSYRFRNLFGQGYHLIPSGSIVYTHGADLSDKDSFLASGGPLHGIAPLRLRGALRYRGIPRLLGIGSNYFFEVDVDHFTEQNRVPEDEVMAWGVEKTEAFTLWGIAAGMSFNTLPGRPKVNLKVKNLLDNEYKPFGSYILGMGRNVKIFVKFAF